jgi:Putative prokaryotic signal transducing protein
MNVLLSYYFLRSAALCQRKTVNVRVLRPGNCMSISCQSNLPIGERIMDQSEPVEVYATLSPSEAEIIKNMLEAEGIEADVTGEIQGSFTGATPEVTIMVRAEDADRARKLILDHQKKAAETPDAVT